MPSKALEVNIETSRVEVVISEKYEILQEVMSKYFGIIESLNIFLTELCHPYKNWSFIVKEARRYVLDYFHLLKGHEKGPAAAGLFMEILIETANEAHDADVKADAVDNLLLFFQKIISDSGDKFELFLPVLNRGFELIQHLEDDKFSLFVRSFYPINRLSREFKEKLQHENGFGPINSLLIKYLSYTYKYWLEQDDPFEWFIKESNCSSSLTSQFKKIFKSISHNSLKIYQNKLELEIKGNNLDSRSLLGALDDIPGYRQIVDTYRDIPQELLKIGSEADEGRYWKLIFLFHIMNGEGQTSIHEEALREINRTLTWMIDEKKPKNPEQLIKKTFDILKESVKKYPGTALNCVQNMGRAVYRTDESDLVDFFMDLVVDLGFQTPDLKGVGDDWQMKVNAAHIQNIRTWMELIKLNPKWSKKLLSSLIIYLSLGGVFMKDTDLFSRDITDFLNSDITPVYNLVKQLTRLFPAYFNDIGAEGQLRDISTKIDEICSRKDVLVHFLRKQSHVESSNHIINLMEATLEFWRSRDKRVLKPYVPSNIYMQIEDEGPYVNGVHVLIGHLFEENGLGKVNELLKVNEENVRSIGAHNSEISPMDRQRLELAIEFYRLLYQKYNLGNLELEHYIKQIQPGTFPDQEKLPLALKETDERQKLIRMIAYLEKLQDTILSSERFEIKEDIYHKRHFTVDIPSMYGSYHELKFDALGLAFRLESQINILFEELVEKFDLDLITRDTFAHIFDHLTLFYQALKLDGITSAEMESQLDLLARALGVMDFSFTQFLDIFRGLSNAVRNIVNDYFNNIHEPNLIKILNQIPQELLLPKYKPVNFDMDLENIAHRVTEIFLRERISSALGLQQLDLFLSRIMKTLFQQSDRLPTDTLRRLLNYDPMKAITPIKSVNSKVSGVIYLGNKGLNLVRLSRYGFPVPPGFIITTEIFRCREVIDTYPPAEKSLRARLAKEISAVEKVAGKSFGNPKNPLLLSVRSGAPISQPGMMETFLDVGINEDIVNGIIAVTGQDWFAWDCYRRFLQTYGMIFGLKRNDFDDIIAHYKDEVGIPYKKDFTGAQMKKVALTYKSFIADNGIAIEDSPWDQLFIAIQKVFDSWDSAKARTYRNIMKISDDWGTAVTVQSMVFGNISQHSGAGVLFTHSPHWSGDMVNLWGDFTLGNQGEDVVSGLVKTLPISIKQAEAENRTDEVTLETRFPEIYQTIRDLAKELIYNRHWGPQEMEFTFESVQKKDLYFLQTRDMAIRERKKVLSFVTTSGAELLSHGIGVSGGAMSGRVIFNLEELQKWRQKEPDTSLILVRGDTVPDDIKEIYGADGLLTARGGSTSHAAIVAHRLGKTCVVGCPNLVCMEKDSSCSLADIHLHSGDWVSIDGREGSIYLGKLEIEEVARR